MDKKRVTGIRKRMAGYLALVILCLFVPVILGADYSLKDIPNVRLSDRNNYVSNPDGIISATDVNRINRLLKGLEDSLGIEVAVVAVEGIGENDARMFATDLFQLWGIGKKADDNGLLIQLVTEPSQRSVVFETGYGLEGVLPDAICYRLQQQYMLPDMRAGDYSSGMIKGVQAVVDYLQASDYERADIIGDPSGTDEPLWHLLLLIIFFPLLFLGIGLLSYQRKYRKQKCPNCGKKTFGLVRSETVHAATYRARGTIEDIYKCTNCGYTERRKRYTDRLRGGGGGPSFSEAAEAVALEEVPSAAAEVSAAAAPGEGDQSVDFDTKILQKSRI